MPNPSTLGLSSAGSEDRLGAGLSRWSATSILVLMGLVGVVLLWRRMAGALGQPLPGATLVGLGVLLAGTTLAVRWLWWWDLRDGTLRRLDRLIPWCPTAALLLIAVAVSVRGSWPTGLVLFWSTLALEEGAAGLWMRRKRRREALGSGASGESSWRVDQAQSPAPHAVLTPASAAATAVGDRPATMDLPAAASLGETVPGDQVTQQFIRFHSAEDGDVFSGWLRLAVPAGSRTMSVHVAFCPPFSRAPAVQVEQVDGPPGRIHTVQVLPYGARLDVKLSQASEEATVVLLRFAASLRDG